MAVKWTDEQLMSLPDTGHKAELVDGRLRMAPAGGEHGDICMRLGSALTVFVRARKLGRTFDSSTGFTMKSGNLRCPDASFVSAARIKEAGGVPSGFMVGAPDLAVEVISPSDRYADVQARIVEYFENGTALAWLVNPQSRRVMVYRASGAVKELDATQSLDGEDVLPGFTFPTRELFDD